MPNTVFRFGIVFENVQYNVYIADPEAVVGNCSCNDYVSDLGYGRCEKDFGKGPVCYVDETSTCTDLVGSSNEPGKQYSWEACSSREFTDKISPSESLYFLLVSSYISIFKYSL